jgi:hypothetical protein
MTALLILWRDPALRLASALIFLVGAIVSTFAPHVSVLAVQRFGLGDAGLAVLMVVSMAVMVTASITIGIRTDQTANRRHIAVIAAALWVAGLATMTVRAGALGFILTQGLLFPVASTLFGQIFALARLAASTYPAEVRDTIMSAVRAVFAAPFVLVLPLWAAAFHAGADVMVIYPVSLAMAGIILALIWRHWPVTGQTAWQDLPSGISFRSALAELSRLPVSLRVLALGAVMAGSTTYITVIGLLMTVTPGRGAPDAALYIGLVAGLEVPLMLGLVPLLRRLPRTVLILAGASIYALHLLFLPLLAPGPLVWLLILPAAIGGALTLTLPIAYMQDMMHDRPGAGSSLITLQQLGAHLIAAACLALGTAIAGYALVLVMGAAVSILGAGLLYLADRSRPNFRPS